MDPMDPATRAALLSFAAILTSLAEGTLDSGSIVHRLPNAEDRWLTPQEAAQQMGVTPRWLARRWRRLPFCHALPGGARGFRVSATELARVMQQQRR
jgi:hypothetical protein